MKNTLSNYLRELTTQGPILLDQPVNLEFGNNCDTINQQLNNIDTFTISGLLNFNTSENSFSTEMDRLTSYETLCFEETTGHNSPFNNSHSSYQPKITVRSARAITKANKINKEEIIGETVGNYKITSLIGSGGMGTVYKAVDLNNDRIVALKLVRNGLATSTENFLHEAHLQSQVEHKNVCNIYEAGEFRGNAYIAMQYIEGATLKEAAPKMSWIDKLKVIAKVARAIHHTHNIGLIHRDIKPDNIMVEFSDENGWNPYIVDFGIARKLENLGKIATRSVVGTPQFMSPEQARGEVFKLDRRADIYSLGATLYWLLSGKFPVYGNNLTEILYKILSEDLIPLRNLNKRIPKKLEKIVMKCLAKCPESRYESAEALAEALETFLGGETKMVRASKIECVRASKIESAKNEGVKIEKAKIEKAKALKIVCIRASKFENASISTSPSNNEQHMDTNTSTTEVFVPPKIETINQPIKFKANSRVKKLITITVRPPITDQALMIKPVLLSSN